MELRRTRASADAWTMLLVAILAMFIVSTIAHLALWVNERALLRDQAQRVAAGALSADEKVARLTSWVYGNQGFRKNRNYHLWKRLDATPTDIYREGGDCEDKSKLLAVMLDEVGVRSSMAMLHPCRGCKPTHTVVIAGTESGTVAADAVYDIVFPNGAGRFHQVDELKRDGSILRARLRDLADERGPGSKILKYKLGIETYDHLRTMNLDKLPAGGMLMSTLAAAGLNPDHVFRPLLFDDPYLLFTVVSLSASVLLAIVLMLLNGRGAPAVARQPDAAPSLSRRRTARAAARWP